MPNKPDKFGIKFWLANEVDSKYVINSFVYLGSDENKQKNDLLEEHVVKKLMIPFENKGHYLMIDNFFCSLMLSRYLFSKKTTLIEIVRANKRFIPNSIEIKKNETVFLENNESILTIYNCKKDKPVFLLSSEHEQVTIPKLIKENLDNSKKKQCYFNL